MSVSFVPGVIFIPVDVVWCCAGARQGAPPLHPAPFHQLPPPSLMLQQQAGGGWVVEEGLQSAPPPPPAYTQLTQTETRQSRSASASLCCAKLLSLEVCVCGFHPCCAKWSHRKSANSWPAGPGLAPPWAWWASTPTPPSSASSTPFSTRL